MFKPKGVMFLTLVIMLMAFSCSGSESDQPLLTAEVPLHLEEHIEAASIEGSEVPENLPAPVEWRFDEPQPDWKPAKPISAKHQAVKPVPVELEHHKATDAAQDDPLSGLDAYIRKAMAEWQVPGLAIAVVKDDAVVFLKGYGVREKGKDASINEQTVFPLASMTKAFTAAAVGILVDEGKLSWDDPVIKHLPWFQLPDPWVTRQVTLRDLLCHRVGGDFGSHLWILSRAQSFSFEEQLKRLRHLEISVYLPRFRSGFLYNSVIGYGVAGAVVAAASGMSWEDFVSERILRPLGMTSATTGQGGSNPAGSMNANIQDTAKWIRLHLAKGLYKGTRLLSEEVIDEMLNPQELTNNEKFPLGAGSGNFWAYGLGWYLTDYRGRKVVMHGGGLHSFIAMMPEENLGVAVLTNLPGLPGWQSKILANYIRVALPFWVFDAYLGTQKRDWSADLLAKAKADRERNLLRDEKLKAQRKRGTQPSLPIESYVGAYAHPGYGQVNVTKEDGNLVLHWRGGNTVDLKHWHYDVFYITDDIVLDFIVFAIDPAGRVQELSFVTEVFKRLSGDSKTQ